MALAFATCSCVWCGVDVVIIIMIKFVSLMQTSAQAEDEIQVIFNNLIDDQARPSDALGYYCFIKGEGERSEEGWDGNYTLVSCHAKHGCGSDFQHQ